MTSQPHPQVHTEYDQVADWTACAKHFGLNSSNSTNSSEFTCSEAKDELTELDLIDNCPTTRSKRMVSRSGMNILGIITFTIGFSFALSALGQPGHAIVQTISVLNEAIMKLVVAVMW